MDNKYVKLHSLLRMFAALLAIIVFVSMFMNKFVQQVDMDNVFVDFATGAFFGGDNFEHGNVIAFIAYLFVLLGGLAGLAFVFIDELLGKDLTKKLSFAVGGVVFVAGILITLFAPIFRALNGLEFEFWKTTAAPIVFGILAILVGAANAAAPILEEKGL